MILIIIKTFIKELNENIYNIENKYKLLQGWNFILKKLKMKNIKINIKYNIWRIILIIKYSIYIWSLNNIFG